MSYSHRPKDIITLKDFRRGTHTYGDTEDTSKFAKIENFEVDKPGLLYKRDPARRLGSTGTVFINGIKWYNENLNGITGWLDTSPYGENSIWVFFGTNAGVDKLQIYSADDWGWEEVLEAWSASGGTCQIIPFNDAIRFANGQDRAPSILVYNYDENFFLGQYQPTAGFSYENSQLTYPTTFSYAVSQGDYGALPVGYYRYKFVPVYDGVQEMPFAIGNSGVAYGYILADNDLGNTIRIVHSSLASQFNKRIKAYKVYRSYNVQNIKAVYNHISTIPLNTSSEDEGQEETLTNCVGSDGTLIAPSIIMVDADVNFLTEEHTRINGTTGTGYYETGTDSTSRRYFINFYNQNGDKKTLRIEDCGDGWCKLVPQLGFKYTIDEIIDRLWLDPYTIDEGVYGTLWVAGDRKQVMEHSNGCAGNNVLYDVNASWLTNQFVNWSCTVNSIVKTTILGNYNNIFKLADGHGVVYSTGITVVANEDSADIVVSGDNVTITFTDTGYADGASHPLDGIEKVFVNYKYGALHNGRLFTLVLSLDPSDEDEPHDSWVGFSEFNQYDIQPVSNIIPLVDKRGGIGTGIISANGYLMVFTETGIFRVNVPGIDPSGWETEQGISNMGCTAPKSIIEAEGVVFFANEKGIYAVNPQDFLLYELTLDRKQDYLDSSNKHLTRLAYDPNKRRLLCNFGDGKSTIYVLDLEMFLAKNDSAWTTMTFNDNYFQPNFFAIDENLDVFSFSNYTTNTQFNQLYGNTTDTPIETMGAIFRTQWLSVPNIDYNAIWRRLQLVFKTIADSTDNDLEDVTFNIYIDKDSDTIEKTFTFSANSDVYTSLSIQEDVYRLSLRSSFLQFEIVLPDTNTIGFELHKVEVTIDD